MNILESILNVIAQPDCFVCNRAGVALCFGCQDSVLGDQIAACYRCNAVSANSQTCATCRKNSSLWAVWQVGFYESDLKALVSELKFESRRHLAKPLGEMMARLIPYSVLASKPVIVPVPTALARVRQRGFDQATLLAAAAAKQTELEYQHWLRRVGGARQLGASKQLRKAQASSQFVVNSSRVSRGASVILVDDVVTTGATLEAAARALRQSGVKRVYGLVVAKDK